MAAPGRGGDRTSNRQIVGRSYAAQAAETLGVHPDTVRRDLRRGKNIDPDVLAEVSGTDLDKGVVLDQLAASARRRASERSASGREAAAWRWDQPTFSNRLEGSYAPATHFAFVRVWRLYPVTSTAWAYISP